MDIDTAAFGRAWEQAWGDCDPISYNLRCCLGDRWVRFHSLPGSQRYAETDEQYAELLHRHHAILAELIREARDNGADLRIVTVSWSEGPQPQPREAEVAAEMPDASYWTSLPTDDSDPQSSWTHLWVSVTALNDDRLTRLLRLAADDIADGVIITSPGMRWLYVPYDGGADVIAASREDRDRLRRRYPEWLSRHAQGL